MKKLSGKQLILIIVAVIFLCACLCCSVFTGFVYYSQYQDSTSAKTTAEKFFANPSSTSNILTLTSTVFYLTDEHTFLSDYGPELSGYAVMNSDTQKEVYLNKLIKDNCLDSVTNVTYLKETSEAYAEFDNINQIYGSYKCAAGTKYFFLEILHGKLHLISISNKTIL